MINTGDLVKFGEWYTGPWAVGLVVEADYGVDQDDSHFFVCWFGNFPYELEWERDDDLICLNIN